MSKAVLFVLLPLCFRAWAASSSLSCHAPHESSSEEMVKVVQGIDSSPSVTRLRQLTLAALLQNGHYTDACVEAWTHTAPDDRLNVVKAVLRETGTMPMLSYMAYLTRERAVLSRGLQKLDRTFRGEKESASLKAELEASLEVLTSFQSALQKRTRP